MTAKQFFDWQTEGGTDDVMRLVDCLHGKGVHAQPRALWICAEMPSSIA